MSQPTTCLATGGAGFLGIDFVRHLLVLGYAVTSLDLAVERALAGGRAVHCVAALTHRPLAEIADHHPLLETDPPWAIGPYGEAKVRPAGWIFKTAGLDFIVPIEQGAAPSRLRAAILEPRRARTELVPCQPRADCRAIRRLPPGAAETGRARAREAARSA